MSSKLWIYYYTCSTFALISGVSLDRTEKPPRRGEFRPKFGLMQSLPPPARVERMREDRGQIGPIFLTATSRVGGDLAFDRLGDAKPAQQRLKLAFVDTPAADGALVDRLAHLRRTRGSHRALCFVE